LIQTNVNFDRKIGDYFSNRSSARLNNNRPRPPAEVLRRRWHTDDHSPHRWSESTGEISAQQTETRNEKPPSHSFHHWPVSWILIGKASNACSKQDS
jgi:hypothetical protein